MVDGKAKVVYKVCAAYDTETNRVGYLSDSRAFVILYQFNDLRSVRLADYAPNVSDDFRFFRDEDEVMSYLRELAQWGRRHNVVPVIAAYNLMFDFQTIAEDVAREWDLQTLAQSTVNVYTIDCNDKETGITVLRFWDTFFMCTAGLAQMGEIAGLPKALGDWDYELQRTPETLLSASELFYAARDVQVIPAYLAYLLHAYEWLEEGMFSSRVVTQTSLVRRYADHAIAPVRVGAKQSVGSLFMGLCKRELPPDWDSYALRKACFRGGLSFTSAAFANVPQRNVASLDVTSMHHTFIPCMIPVKFVHADVPRLTRCVRSVLQTSVSFVLEHYARPFVYGLHVAVRFTGLRLRQGTCFADWGVATLARAKVGVNAPTVVNDLQRNEAFAAQETNVRKSCADKVAGGEYAFGKLYAADVALIHLTEIELYIMSLVYEWDTLEVLDGECTSDFREAPDYVVMQSQHWYAVKSAVKKVTKTYVPGQPCGESFSQLIPEGMRRMIADGSLSVHDLASYYLLTKNMFNSIYGTQAQDVFKAGYLFDDVGMCYINAAEITNADNYMERVPDRCKVLYTYGMRIVGRSRLHLILAMCLLHAVFGKRIRVTGGDTDSLKIACENSVTDDELLDALKPLHDAADSIMNASFNRVRSVGESMIGVGRFEVEDCGVKGVKRYPWHMELWTKCRVSFDIRGDAHVTCAGLSRPAGKWNIETVYDQLAGVYSPFYALTHGLGYNVTVADDTAHFLQRNRPLTVQTVRGRVTDYLGDTVLVDRHEAQALWNAPRVVGDTNLDADNADNVEYLWKHYGRRVDDSDRVINMHSLGAIAI